MKKYVNHGVSDDTVDENKIYAIDFVANFKRFVKFFDKKVGDLKKRNLQALILLGWRFREIILTKRRNKMVDLFHVSEKMKYISAKLYYVQGKIYSIVETEQNFYFGQQNGAILEKIAFFSRDAHFICNNLYTNVYVIEVIEKQLKITILPEQKESFFELSNADEFVIGLTAGKHSVLIKTCRDLSDEEQEINLYYVDLKTGKIILCNDNMMKKSYCMPYISTYGDKEYILAESAVINPDEIYEAKNNSSFICNNKILTLWLQGLIQSMSKNEELRWNVIFSAKDGYYITLLKASGSHLWVSETAVDETKTNIVKYDLSKGSVEFSLSVENRIDRVVFDGNELLCMYKWNSSKEIVDIFSAQGEIISHIDYSSLTKEHDEIELNEVLTFLHEQYVVFDATDYSGDESYQCRVIYDIINNQFMLKNNSYVEFNGLIY